MHMGDAAESTCQDTVHGYSDSITTIGDGDGAGEHKRLSATETLMSTIKEYKFCETCYLCLLRTRCPVTYQMPTIATRAQKEQGKQ